MLQIGDTIISSEILEEDFLCDLLKCLGQCCVDGDSGAPLTKEEISILKEIEAEIWEDLTPEAQTVIKKQGAYYIDEDGDYVTSLVNKKECVYAYYDKDNICKCAIEKAYKEKKISFYKPISCHLYPIRVTEYSKFTALNYHKWSVCGPARICGKKNELKVYQFLKEALIRRFGEEWYEQLEIAAKEIESFK